jgi:hypothetical protein
VNQVHQLADQAAGQRGGSGVERRLSEALGKATTGASPLKKLLLYRSWWA